MICKNCNEKLENNSQICPYCGCSQEDLKDNLFPDNYNKSYGEFIQNNQTVNNGSIFDINYIQQNPNQHNNCEQSKKKGKGCLIAIIIAMVILFFVVGSIVLFGVILYSVGEEIIEIRPEENITEVIETSNEEKEEQLENVEESIDIEENFINKEKTEKVESLTSIETEQEIIEKEKVHGVNIKTEETIETNKKVNLLLNINYQEIPMMNGVKTQRIGTVLRFLGDNLLFGQSSVEEIKEFFATKVEPIKQDYNYVVIDFLPSDNGLIYRYGIIEYGKLHKENKDFYFENENDIYGVYNSYDEKELQDLIDMINKKESFEYYN